MNNKNNYIKGIWICGLLDSQSENLIIYGNLDPFGVKFKVIHQMIHKYF